MRGLRTWISLVFWAPVSLMLAVAASQVAAAAPAPERYCCLSKERVCVDSTYTGDSVVVSGVAEPGAQIVVKVSSAPGNLKLARKGRVGPIWMNVSEVEFTRAPAFYQVNSTGTLNPVLSPEMMERCSLGYEGLKRQMVVRPAAEDNPANFKEFVSLKESGGFYGVRPRGVQVDSGGTFHTRFVFPSGAPTGTYDVTVYEVKDGRVIREAAGHINIEKVGLTRWLSELAERNGAAYGLLAVVSALGAGLVVGFIFKGAKGH